MVGSVVYWDRLASLILMDSETLELSLWVAWFGADVVGGTGSSSWILRLRRSGDPPPSSGSMSDMCGEAITLSDASSQTG